MNSLEKAQALIADKNISLKDLANKCKHSSYSTLRYDRVNLEKLEDASYKRIHELAKIYDEKKPLIKSSFLVSSSESMDIADNDTPSKSTASHRKSTNSTLLQDMIKGLNIKRDNND